jgi:iron complex outermembrane receptor protein
MGRPSGSNGMQGARQRATSPKIAGIGAACALLACTAAHADPADPEAERLANMSLEELMRVPVTTVAGTAQSRIASPAALYVITAEEIRRSGHRTVAEALRLVPGMHVGRINSSSWVIGARGLTGTALSATRYLVQVDGRVVYDPLVSTTFWDTVDLVLEDIDRIEVIRGPGATLWGQNAMNGVVSIITRRAQDTRGTLASVAVGDHGEDGASLRYGDRAGADGAFRVWAKYARHGDFELAGGTSVRDRWSDLRAGLRYDRTTSSGIDLTLQSEAYTHPTAEASVLVPVPGQHLQFQRVTGDDDVSGGSFSARASRGSGEAEGWSVLGWFDRALRDTARYGSARSSASVDFRRWTALADDNRLMYGATFLHHSDQVDNGPAFVFDPASRDWSTVNAFVQDTMDWAEERWHTTLGSKVSYHDFVGWFAQPSARVWWTPSERQTIWAAVSRPVRVPSRFEEDGLLVFSYLDTGLATGHPASGTIVPLGVAGDDEIDPEELLAWELGHRFRVGDAWTFETSLFFNDYGTLIQAPPGIFGRFTDAGSGDTWGFDVSASWRPLANWRLEASYSRLHTRISGPVFDIEEGSTPHYLAQLRSYLDIGDHLELNGAVYHVDSIPRQNIDSYTRADLGLTWRASRNVALSLWGQNLLDEGHAEASGALVPRTVYAELRIDVPR